MFDGRLAVITSLGQRIPIAEVHPVFGCGVPGPNGANPLSMIVECSVFEIRTPGGEVYTLPIHEIKAFHALTPELVEEIGRSAGLEGSGDTETPFGFAAFTSLARNQGTLVMPQLGQAVEPAQVDSVTPWWRGVDQADAALPEPLSWPKALAWPAD